MASFAELLKTLRTERNLSQRELADQLFVDRTTIAHWESGRRIPDTELTLRLADFLNVDVSLLLGAEHEKAAPNVILVDDEHIQVKGMIPILEEALPGAEITGFTKVSEAVAFAKESRIALAFLDIEIGKNNGISLCDTLLEINPLTNVIFLTSYSNYALNAWETPASGFLLKPIRAEQVRKQIMHLRHPVAGLL